MAISNQVLIEDLVQRTKDTLNQAVALQERPLSQLNWKANAESWSVLECLEHLNRYGDFYLPEIAARLAKAAPAPADATFRSGWLGDYFAKTMLPREQLNKMKTFASMNPNGSQLDSATLRTFISQQKQLLDLLQQARKVDMTRTKTAISISRWIKLRLGDTFRVVIYHNQRHLVQAARVLAQQGVAVQPAV